MRHCDLLCVTRFCAHSLPSSFAVFASLTPQIPASTDTEPNVSIVPCFYKEPFYVRVCECLCVCVCVYSTCLIALGWETLSFIDISWYCVRRNQNSAANPSTLPSPSIPLPDVSNCVDCVLLSVMCVLYVRREENRWHSDQTCNCWGGVLREGIIYCGLQIMTNLDPS